LGLLVGGGGETKEKINLILEQFKNKKSLLKSTIESDQF
jgi:hypothetical protein